MYSKEYRARMANYDRMRNEQIKVSHLIKYTKSLKSRAQRKNLLSSSRKNRSVSPTRQSAPLMSSQNLTVADEPPVSLLNLEFR